MTTSPLGPSDRTPTVVLVHGAFADASSWAGVKADFPVLSNPPTATGQSTLPRSSFTTPSPTPSRRRSRRKSTNATTSQRQAAMSEENKVIEALEEG